VQSPEASHAGLGVAPEALDPVDVRPPNRKFVLPVPDPVVLAVSDVHEAVVSAPTVGVDDAPGLNPPPDYALQRGPGAVGNDLRVDAPLPFEQAEHDGFPQRAPAPDPLDAPRPEVALVHLHLARHR